MVRIMYGLTRWTSPCWLSIKFLCSLVHLVPKTREEGTLLPSSSVSFLFYIGCSGQGHTLLSFLFTKIPVKFLHIQNISHHTICVQPKNNCSLGHWGAYQSPRILWYSGNNLLFWLPSTNDHIIVPIFTIYL